MQLPSTGRSEIFDYKNEIFDYKNHCARAFSHETMARAPRANQFIACCCLDVWRPQQGWASEGRMGKFSGIALASCALVAAIPTTTGVQGELVLLVTLTRHGSRVSLRNPKTIVCVTTSVLSILCCVVGACLPRSYSSISPRWTVSYRY